MPGFYAILCFAVCIFDRALWNAEHFPNDHQGTPVAFCCLKLCWCDCVYIMFVLGI